MLPLCLSGKIRAYPTGFTANDYRQAIQVCAGRNVKLDDRGRFIGWQEKSVLTFGASAWYKDASDLTLESFLAIGIPATDPDTDRPYVATISAFPVVSSNLAAVMPRALERVSGKSVTSSAVRAKLGTFLQNKYEGLRGDLLSLHFVLENGSRITVQKGKSQELQAPDKRFLQTELENGLPTTAESGWLQGPGLELLSLNGKYGTISVARDLSIQLLDVAADLNEVAGSLSDLLGMLVPYLEVESSSAQASVAGH